MPSNSTANATPNNHSAANLTVRNNTLTPHENHSARVAGVLFYELLNRLKSWWSSWFSKSSHERLVQSLKIDVSQSRLNKLFQSLDAEISKLKNDPTSINNMQRGISEYFNNTKPYEQLIASKVMSNIYGFLQGHKLTNKQITQAITLIDLTENLEQPKPKKEKNRAPKLSLLKPKSAANEELLILTGKEFLQIFTGDSQALKTTTRDVAIEIGHLFHQFRMADLNEGLACALSQEASLFIGRAIANNRHRFGSQTRQIYLVEGDRYNDSDYLQTSLRFLQVLLHTSAERQQQISAQTLVNALEPLHNNLMAARPGESTGNFEVVNDPNLSTDIEVLGEMLRHSALGELGVPITTITTYVGASFTEEELNYLRAYDIDVPTQAPVSVSELVITHQYRAALRASPPQDLPRLTEHFFQLLLSFSRRDENVRNLSSTNSSPSAAELINAQRQRERNVFGSREEGSPEADAQTQQRRMNP